MLLVLVAAAGCGGTPRAPILSADPVYNNSREGFRFLVPEGWTQNAIAEVPPGPATTEQRLVEYQITGTEKPGSFRVTCIDLPEEENLEQYLQKRFPDEGWKPSAPAENVEAGGAAATHATLTRKAGNEDVVQDVYAFRHGKRVYLFTGLLVAEDAKARQQVQRAVESLKWR
jgi:hypothetical protein